MAQGTLNLLVRAKTQHEAELRLWKGLQLHMDFPRSMNICIRVSESSAAI